MIVNEAPFNDINFICTMNTYKNDNKKYVEEC